jgi:hypothetical protein
MKGNTMLQKLVTRLQEPSTWAGLSALAMLFGVPANTVDLSAKAAGAVLALGAVFLPEKK